MSAICTKCGKKSIVGRRVTFSGKRNRRVFRVNLHTFWLTDDGKRVKGRFCTKCLRVVKGKVTRKPRASRVSETPVVVA